MESTEDTCTSQQKGSFKISFVAQRYTFSTRFSKPMDCGDHTWVAQPRWHRNITCTTRLGAMDVLRSSAHKAKEFVGFRTLFSHLFVNLDVPKLLRNQFELSSRFLIYFYLLFWLEILNAKVFYRKHLSSLGQQLQNTSENRDTRAIFNASHFSDEFAYVLLCRVMFLQSAFQFGFLPSKPCLFPLKSSLEFVLHRGEPKFISFPVKSPADRSKFQFYTTARSKLIIIFPRTVLPCLCFFSKSIGRNNDTYAFQYTFKHNTTKQAKKKKKKRKNKVVTFTTMFAVSYLSSSSPRPTGLNLSGATKKPSFSGVIARYVFLVYVAMLYMNYLRCGDCAFSASFVRQCTDVNQLRYGAKLFA